MDETDYKKGWANEGTLIKRKAENKYLFFVESLHGIQILKIVQFCRLYF